MTTFRHITLLLALTLAILNVVAQSKKNKKDDLSYKDRLKFERLYIDASKAKILGDYEQAIKLYDGCTKIAPKEPAPYFELGNLYLNLSERDLAIENAEKAKKLEPSNFFFRLLYAESLKGNQEFEKASEEFEAIIDDFPKKISTYIELALIYVFVKDYKKAIDIYNRLEIEIGPNEEVKLKKQYLYLQLGEVNKAAEEIQDLIKLQPDNVQNYLLLAELYYVNDQKEKAQRAYKKAVERFPKNSKLHLSLADFYRKDGQIDKAFDHLKTAFEDSHLEIDVKVKGILSYFDIADREPIYREDLVELGQILLKTNPNDARIMTINGDISLNMNKTELARKYFMRAVELDNSRYPIWSQLLILEADLGIYDTLVDHSREAIELFPNQPVCYYFLGFGLSQLKEPKEAADVFSRGVKLVLDNKALELQFYLSMADAYNEAGEYNESDAAFEKALEIDNENSVALNNYSYYLSLRGENLEKALKMSKKSNDLETNQPTYLDTYAWIFYKMGRYEEAREYLQKALDHGGASSGVILEHMGDVLFKLDRQEEAMEYWKRAKEVGDTTELIDKKISDKKLYE